MNLETIFLIVSLCSNALIVAKKVKVIWTPCCIISCQDSSQDAEEEQPSTTSIRVRELLERITPRRKQSTPASNTAS